MYSVIYLCFTILIFYTDATAFKSRVFGGVNLRSNVHTYLVKLYIIDSNHSIYSGCSGSVISRDWIISAAHCFTKDVNFVSVEQPHRLIAAGKPSKIVSHPNYVHGKTSMKNYEADLALLKMERKIQFNNALWPIALSMRPVTIGQEVIIAGYGASEIGNKVPREGHTVITPCDIGSGYKVICTYSRVFVGDGDSGGALVSKDGMVLIGVTSNSYVEVDDDNNCQSMYVDVAKHMIWILNVTLNT